VSSGLAVSVCVLRRRSSMRVFSSFLFFVALVAAYGVWVQQSDGWKRAPVPVQRSTGWMPRIHAFLCSIFERWFGVTNELVFEETLDLSRRFCFALAPHGAFVVSWLVFLAPLIRTDDRFVPLRVALGGASVLFFLPIIRELLLLLNARDADYSNLDALARAGHSVALVPGGIHEQVRTREDQEVIYVQRRLGFIRLALRHGIDLVPVYGFGENQLFRTYSCGASMREWLAQVGRVGLPLIHPLPRAVHTCHVFGRPIPVGDPDPAPTEAKVQAIFEAYEAELRRIFTKHAARHLPTDVVKRGLHVVRVSGRQDWAVPRRTGSHTSVPRTAIPRQPSDRRATMSVHSCAQLRSHLQGARGDPTPAALSSTFAFGGCGGRHGAGEVLLMTKRGGGTGGEKTRTKTGDGRDEGEGSARVKMVAAAAAPAARSRL